MPEGKYFGIVSYLGLYFVGNRERARERAKLFVQSGLRELAWIPCCNRTCRGRGRSEDRGPVLAAGSFVERQPSVFSP